MAVEIDKDILLDNIQYLLKERGIKLGDFEKDTGVYPGYLSRINKESSAKPGFDFIVKASDILDVTIDSLLRHRFNGTTPTEKYIEHFLSKLIRDTDADLLSWNVEDTFDLSLVGDDGRGHADHNLFTVSSVMKKDSDGDLIPEEKTVFVSKTYGYLTDFNGNCYNIGLKNNSTFYLMDVRCEKTLSDGPASVLEAWFFIPLEGKSFLYSTRKDDYLAELLRGLHSSIEENLKHPKVDVSVKNIIDAYMKDDFSDDTEKWDPDDVPF